MFSHLPFHRQPFWLLPSVNIEVCVSKEWGGEVGEDLQNHSNIIMPDKFTDNS